jgi:hypothetical protein
MEKHPRRVRGREYQYEGLNSLALYQRNGTIGRTVFVSSLIRVSNPPSYSQRPIAHSYQRCRPYRSSLLRAQSARYRGTRDRERRFLDKVCALHSRQTGVSLMPVRQ